MSNDALIIRRLFISKSNAINLTTNLLKTIMMITMSTLITITISNSKTKTTTIKTLKSVVVIITIMLIA